MRADLRRLVAASLFLSLMMGAPLAAHADEAGPADAAPAAIVEPPAIEPPAAVEAPASEHVEEETEEEEEEKPEPETPAVLTDPAPSTAVTLTNAQFRWSLNELQHRAPHFGVNFITAGLLADTGGAEMPPGRWKQTDGAVRIERAGASKYVPATWAGFGTGVDHQVVIDGGAGTIDPATGSGRIAWRGSFGVARYSGLTAFSVSDPVLTVEQGVATLRGRLSGFGVSRDGNGAGAPTGPIAQDDVVLADLGRVDLSQPTGVTMVPAFYGVAVSHAEYRPDQDGRAGSFPASFIAFVDKVGQAPFWMTSGSDDDAKAGAPISVSFDASAPVATAPRPVAPKKKKPKVTNTASKAPPAKPAPSPQPAPAPAALPDVASAPVAPAPVSVAFTNTATVTAAPPTALVGPRGRAGDLGWWIAATFLLMSAGAVAAPTLLVRPRAA